MKHETHIIEYLGSKRSLVMKFDQLMQYYKIIFVSKKFLENEKSFWS